jgi:hypothetical protein
MDKDVRARANRHAEVDRRICRRHGPVLFALDGQGTYRCRKCRSEAVARRRRRLKQILVTEAGGRCRVCGYDKCAAALQFHHLDPEEKAFGLAQGGLTRSLDEARREADKCVLLCSNCHAEIEAGVTALPVEFSLALADRKRQAAPNPG